MKPRSLSWPTPQRLATGIGGAVLVALVFFPIYIGCAALTATRASQWQLYADWELSLPFWPFMIVPYLSMFVLFLLPPFQLDETELRTLTLRLCVASLLGGALFLAFPAQMGFLPRGDAGIWQGIYSAIYRIDGPFNTVPSFHVIYTASILYAMIDVASPTLRRLYVAWLVAVCASTVLTHRHHLLDVVVGLALASFVPVLLRRRPWVAFSPARRLHA
jgi:PAP2 superfamily